MANRNFPSARLFSFQGMAVMLQASAIIDSSQTSDTDNYKVRSVKGSGIKSIKNVGTGLYKISLEDSYAHCLAGASGFVSSVTGNTAIASRSNGVLYVIRTLGTSTQANWETAGVPAGVPAAVGLAFVATGTGGSLGSGTLYTPVASGISSIEIVGDPNLSMSNTSDPHFFIQCLGESLAMASYTPAGSNSAPALTMDSYTPAGTNANDGPPETFTGTPAVLTGSVAAPVFSGTPATLTGTVSLAAAAPVDGSVLMLQIMLRNSSLKEKGE